MIEVRHLRKRYGGTTALDDVSFTVQTGSICGLLGPNGAGKSTTMNIMTGCLAASSGEVLYDGLEIYADMKAVKRSIGYLPEQPPLYPDMTVEEYLVFVGRAKGLSRQNAEIGCALACRTCGLEEVSFRLIKNLSKGYRQRVGIAQALVGDPQTIILDEPTVGLDPIQIIEIRELIRRMAHERTVLVSSHILSEIRALCDQIVIISHGKLVADDTPENLERRFAGSRTTALSVLGPLEKALEIAARVPHVAEALPASSEAAQGQLPSAPETDPASEAANVGSAGSTAPDECSLSVVAEGDADVREALFRAFAEAGMPIVEMATTKASLEDVFVELAEGGEAC